MLTAGEEHFVNCVHRFERLHADAPIEPLFEALELVSQILHLVLRFGTYDGA